MAHTQSYARKMLSLDLFVLRAHSPFLLIKMKRQHICTHSKKNNVIASNAVFYWIKTIYRNGKNLPDALQSFDAKKKHAHLYVRLLVCLTTIKIISTFANQLNSDPSITSIKCKKQQRRIQTITIAVGGFSVRFNWLEIFARMWTWP